MEVGNMKDWRTTPGFVAFRVVEVAGRRYIDVSHYTEDGEEWKYAFEKHRRSKNFFARIVAPDDRYKFKREFLKFEKFDGEPHVLVDNFEPGDLFDIRFIYYTGSWSPRPNLKGIFEFVGFDGEFAVFKKISETEALNKLAEKGSATYRFEVSEERLKELAKLYKKAELTDGEYAAGFRDAMRVVLAKLGLLTVVTDYIEEDGGEE